VTALAVALAGIGCDLAPDGGALSDDSAIPTAPSGFPCDVRAMMETYCAPCHSGNMYVNPFTTRDDFLSPRGAGTFGQYAAMMVMTEMMPPSTAAAQPTPGERAILIDWVAAGMPAGPCAPLTPPETR